MEINEREAGTPTGHPVEGGQPEAPETSKRPDRWTLVRRLDRSPRATKPAPLPRNAPVRPAQRNTGWTVLAVLAVGVLVVGIIAVGFRGSLGALRDAAIAAHIESDAARLYWIGVDGLIVVAIIAALVLRNDKAAVRYCLTIVASFTLASWLLNFLHGLGLFTPKTPGGTVPNPPWGVVLVIASLVIGTIFFGTHLLVYVLRHLFPGTPVEQEEDSPATVAESATDGDSGTPGSPPAHPAKGVQRTSDEDLAERKKWAGVAYGLALDKGVTIPKVALAEAFQISTRQAGYVRSDVDLEREERAKRDAAAATPNAAPLTPASVTPPPSLNGSHPVSAATP